MPNGATVSSFSKTNPMNDTAIEWSKYNLFERAIFWCALHLNIVFPVFLLVVSIVMLINCRAAYQLLEEEKERESAVNLTRPQAVLRLLAEP